MPRKPKTTPAPEPTPPLPPALPWVIADNREKPSHRWDFAASSTLAGTKPGTLRTADYCLEGHESGLVLERKGSVVEFAQCLTSKRFENELIRMQNECSHPVVILEFDFHALATYPHGSGLPPAALQRCRVTGAFLVKRLSDLSVKYPKVNFIFAGSHGKHIASALLKAAAQGHKQCLK